MSTPEHATATSVVLRAIDTFAPEKGSEPSDADETKEGSAKLTRDVVIKLMTDSEVFIRELQQRKGTDSKYVVPVTCLSELPKADPGEAELWSEEWSEELKKLVNVKWSAQLEKLGRWKTYRFGIVMPAAQRNLMVIVLQERLTLDDIRDMFDSLARSIGHLHAIGRIHGDIKPLNVVRAFDGSIMLIDLDMTVELGEPVGAKQLSTAFVGPETTYAMSNEQGGITAEFRKADAYANGVAIVPLRAPKSAKYGGGEGYSSDGLLLAKPAFDIWSCGVMLYYTIAYKPLLETTGADQLRSMAERAKLASWTTVDLTNAINDLDHGEFR